jgi:predicted site-specific integrase-resolvase
MTEADDPTPAKRAIPALMRTAEVKEYFDVSDRTLRRWEDNGYLVPRRIGSTLFYRWEDIQAALDGKRPACAV